MQITIGITSHNRGLYLDALFHSLRDEIKQYGHQLIVVDNSSTEDEVLNAAVGARDIIDEWHGRHDPDWINDEYIAKNIIIEQAKHNVILFMQDDSQFIGPSGSISQHAEALITSGKRQLLVQPARKATLQRTVGDRWYYVKGLKVWEQAEHHFHTTGYFTKDTFNRLGKYPVQWPKDKTYWGRSEDWYDAEVKRMFGREFDIVAHVPTFVPVWNDPRGGYAFNREGRRWGHYEGPVDQSRLYYEMLTEADVNRLNQSSRPCSFTQVARPLGWKLSLDEHGETKKHPQQKTMEEER